MGLNVHDMIPRGAYMGLYGGKCIYIDVYVIVVGHNEGITCAMREICRCNVVIVEKWEWIM